MLSQPIPGRTYIYVIGPDVGPLKIGISKDPKKRLSHYKTHNYTNVKFLFLQNCSAKKAKAIEKIVHRRLINYKHHGEWFNTSLKTACAAIRVAMTSVRQPPITYVYYTTRYYADMLLIPYDRLYLTITDNLQPTDNIFAKNTICIISRVPNKTNSSIRYKIDFELGHYKTDLLFNNSTLKRWQFAPQAYRKWFTDLPTCIEYAEQLIFDGLQKAQSQGKG